MPIYEYRRPDGSTFEIQQPFSDDPLTHDPDTGVKVQRVLHAPAVHFKGSGFYNTDYGTRKRQRESAAAESSKSSSGSSSEGSGAGSDGAGKDSGSSQDNGKGSAEKAAAGAKGDSGSRVAPKSESPKKVASKG